MPVEKLEKCSIQNASAAKSRTFYVDNLRTALTTLVIYHHTAICYGGEGNSPYQSTFIHEHRLLGWLGLTSFFIGSFFYISGCFSRKALERKTPKAFLKDRLYRLGIPTLAYTLLGPPATRALSRIAKGQALQWPILTDWWLHEVRRIRGPVWFTGNLLVFDIIYVYGRSFFNNGNSGKPVQQPVWGGGSQTERNKILAFAGSVIACFLNRLYYPVGTNFGPLSVQPGYLPKYVLAYISGTGVYDLVDAVPSLPFIITLVVCSVVSGAIAIGAIVRDPASPKQVWGGWNHTALCYAVRNESTGYLMASAVFCAFKNSANLQWASVADYAYPAFLIHMLPVTYFGQITDSYKASGAMKTMVIGTISTLTSWASGYMLSKMVSMLKFH